MIRFNIEGEYLDMPADYSYQLQRKNILFAFDKAECDRTTSFDIPATPTNNRIFALAKDVAMYGIGMRRQYAAQLQAGFVTKDGYLYVSSYEPDDNGGKYKAIFLTGELLGLKALRDLGKLNEIAALKRLKYAVRKNAQGQWASTCVNDIWQTVAYHEDNGLHPSIGLTPLLNLLGYDDRDHLATGLNLRFIPAKLNGVQADYLDYNVTIDNSTQGDYVPMAQTALNVSEITMVGRAASESYYNDVFFDAERVLVKYTSGGSAYHAYVTQLRAKYHTLLYFPNNTSADYFIGYFNPQTGSGQDYGDLSDFTFLGGYSFDAAGNVTGTPLAGRDVDMPASTLFCVIKKEWFANGIGWKIDTPTFSINGCNVLCDEWGSNSPAIYRLTDNLPDFTVVDIFKTVAAMTGTALYYTDIDGIVLDRYILNGGRFDLGGKVIKMSSLTRTFGDYAQHNYVQYKDDENQYENELAILDYIVDNDNLTEEAELYTIPAGNGGMYNGEPDVLLIRGEQSVDIIARYDSNEAIYLCRTPLELMSDIQDLCTFATSISMQVKMSLLEYERITVKTQLYYNGILYLWTESRWAKGVATFNLSKLHS